MFFQQFAISKKNEVLIIFLETANRKKNLHIFVAENNT